MSIPVPAPREPARRNFQFEGILRGISVEDDSRYGRKQVKFAIEPTSYDGKIRYEWYPITERGNSKYAALLDRLRKLDLFDERTGIRDEKALNKTFVWEMSDRDPNWPPVECRECGEKFHTDDATNSHRRDTGHNVKRAGFILPVRVIGEEPKTLTASNNGEVEKTLISMTEAYGQDGVVQTELISECEKSGFRRPELVSTLIRLKKEGRILEKDGKVTLKG